MPKFLPISKQDMLERGWEELDFIYVSGDAYVDHPSFGVAIITRVLEAGGYKVGVISQPNWNNNQDFERFGRPRLGFFVSSGNIDSMVAHYTASKKKRSEDEFTPGGKAGARPDRAVIVYCNKIREIYGDVPIIIGGLEASLRRFAHYDYWDDKLRRSILFDSSADILSYGMGENQTRQIADRLNAGEKISNITDVLGTCYACDVQDTPLKGAECPSFENVVKSKKEYAISCRIQQDEQDHIRGKLIKQRHGKKMLVQNPPMPPLTTEELDVIYSLDYCRTYHPSYEALGGVTGIEEVRFSITHNRGCFGACNFCSIAFHQGRYVTVRSQDSVISEAKYITNLPDFKGYIHDVGGPTANFRRTSCDKQLKNGLCKGKKCLAPKACPALKPDHSDYLDLLRKLRTLPKVKKVFIRSGIRYDYMLKDKDDSFFKELVQHHVSGQLKVAPEHCSACVLEKMGKPYIDAYINFSKKYFEFSKNANKEQYLVPYLMSSHPGSKLEDAIELALFLKKRKIRPEQVQDFYPTPGTISTCMFYTGIDPYTMEEIFVAKTYEEKQMQRALLQYYNPRNQEIIEKALKKANRYDLIGNGEKCLIRPSAKSRVNMQQKANNSRNSNGYKKKNPTNKNKRRK